MSTEKTIVIFRRWKDTGNVVAIFPEIPSDNQGYMCEMFEHHGQHTGRDCRGVVGRTTPAKGPDVKALARELRGRGYRLLIRRKAHHTYAEKRMREARAGR